MKLWRKLGAILALGALCATGASLIRDKQVLREDLVRLHVVANSDTKADQDLKLKVRDAVTEQLNQVMAQLDSAPEAVAYLRDHLTQLQDLANETLRQTGSEQTAQVSLDLEAFPTRIYDTFQLPAGIYEALRITIGEGEGHNWWCVVFPTLCMPASSEGFEAEAEAAGFTETLAGTLTQDSFGYQLRFKLLDLLGQAENWLRG